MTNIYTCRAKRIDNNEWTHGFIISYVEGGNPIIVYQANTNNYGTVDIKYHEVLRETICRYTNLKDKNGRTIIEGDILEGMDESSADKKLYEVIYIDNGFYYKDMGNLCWNPDEIMGEKVIGNVIDNEELLWL